jgi:arylsulfatase A-like enzyme
MSPVATMFVFLLLSLPLSAAALVRRGGLPERLITWGLGMLALTSVLLPVRLLHPVAALLLASGLAAVGSRILVSPVAYRRVLTAGLLLVVAPAMITAAVLKVPSRSAKDRTPPADAPNVLVLILDTVRADALSVYGAPYETTPRLDSLARTATLFRWAMAPSPWTLPSHSSFFTGYRPSELSARWSRRLDSAKPTLAEVMSDAGWRTGGFAGNQAYAAWGSGLSRGFDRYWSTPISLSQLKNSVTLVQVPLVRRLWAVVTGRATGGTGRGLGLELPFVPKRDLADAKDILREFKEWRAEDGARPFFAFVNLIEAHQEGMVPEHWTRRFNNGKTSRDRYNGKVAWEDSVVGALLDTLQAEGTLDRTLVIVSSDHGEMFNHNLNSHGNSVYLGVLHVPLIVRFPGTKNVTRSIDAPVSLQDLPATVLDVVGLPGTMPGRSWRKWFSDSAESIVVGAVEHAPPPVESPALHGPLRFIIDHRWHCILNADGRMQVYAYRDDPDEENDLASTDIGRKASERCREMFRKIPFGYQMVTNR